MSTTPYTKRTLLAFALGLLLVIPVLPQSIVQLLPVADASLGYHDNYNSANTNYNSAIHYSAFAQPGNNGGVNKGRGVMQFDLSVIPPNSTVLGAFLTLYASGPVGVGAVSSVGHVGNNSSKLKRITSPWNASTVTWNTMPSFSSTNQTSLPSSTTELDDYLFVNVTALVQDMVDEPATSHGFMLQLDNETVTRGLFFFSSGASEPDKRPLLTIVYGECPDRTDIPTVIPPPTIPSTEPFIWPTISSRGGEHTIDHPAARHGATIKVTNSLGAIVLELVLQGERSTIQEIGGLSSGSYWITLTSKDGSSIGTQQIVVR